MALLHIPLSKASAVAAGLLVVQVVRVLGFRLPFYKTPTLLLSLGLSIRVLWHLIVSRPDVIHASSPGRHCAPAAKCPK